VQPCADSAVLQGQGREMSDLFQRRRQIELQLVEAKIARQDQYQQQLAQARTVRARLQDVAELTWRSRAQIRVHDAEGFTNMKITLENNIQVRAHVTRPHRPAAAAVPHRPRALVIRCLSSSWRRCAPRTSSTRR
jgi:hypothetical protein